ncbi:MAG: MarR family transcriptional regulator [Pseudonocardia sp.]|nr:MarR family transcriptional regulator [Pseudonocardia sp.]
MDDRDRRRLLAKVARLYYHSGLRQTEIADRLRISQTRVSRLLQQAEAEGIVQTVVVPLVGLNVEIEEQLEDRYALAEVHVIEAVSDDEAELSIELGAAAAAIFATMPVEMPVVGLTSWSRTLRHMVESLRPVRTGTATVVEMLGDLGPPDQQYEAARATQRLATLTGAEPVFLRTPGVVSSAQVRDALLAHDAYARQALGLLDALDLALVGVGPCDVVPPLQAGNNFFSEDDLREVVAAGAVGQLCLRFLDAEDTPVATPLDDLVTGVTPEQLRAAKRRWVVAGGPSKYPAMRAVLLGGWADTVVTDAATARWLMAAPPPTTAAGAGRRG